MADLPATDSDGQSDPYVEVYCDGQTVVSKVIDNTLNPLWYKVLRLNIDLLSASDSPPIIVYVKDKDILKTDDLIGVCTYYVRQSEVNLSRPSYPA